MVDAVLTVDRTSADSRSRRLLRRVRQVWLVLAVFLFGTFMVSLAGTYRMLQTPCSSDGSDCASWAQPTAETVAQLEAAHVSLPAFALYFVVLYGLVSLTFWAVGLLIYRHRADQWFALLVAHLMVLVGTGGVSLVFASGLDFVPVPLIVNIVVGLMTLAMYQILSVFLLAFPNGRFYGRWNAIPFILICLNTLAWLIPPPYNIQFWPGAVSSAWLLVVFGSHLLAQVVRYRRMYTRAEREQTKWLIYGFSVPVLMFFGISVVLGASTVSSRGINPLINGTLVVILYIPISLSVGIAILRYRLWNIDVIINRTLVYGTLTVILVALYALIVSALSSVVNNDRSFTVSFLSAGVMAVVFQPLRQTTQRTVNRYIFGRRDEPIEVISQISQTLEAVLSPEAAQAELVQATARALKLPYIAIVQTNFDETASVGTLREPVERFPLIYHARVIGYLVAASRSPAESLNAADRVVLDYVARQAGNIVHAARLTDDLQESRHRLVTAREEERRRLRRDLHDGLGPTLAALTLQAEAARELLRSDLDRSDALLGEIVTGTQGALADIRRVVYALRPPALDDLGLSSAIREQVSRCASPTLTISADIPEQLPPLSAAVEVAIYRIVQEALVNVTRHAEAHSCRVALHVDDAIELEIADDGKGIPATHHAGVGLNSMHERAAELGGACVIESQIGQGTRIVVSLPQQKG